MKEGLLGKVPDGSIKDSGHLQGQCLWSEGSVTTAGRWSGRPSGASLACQMGRRSLSCAGTGYTGVPHCAHTLKDY